MRRRRSISARLFFLLLLGGACSLVFYGVNFVVSIPEQTESMFGPAAATLSPQERFSLSISLWRNQGILITPNNPGASMQLFEIAADEAAVSVIARLALEGVIKDQASFRDYLIYKGFDIQIQAGEHQLSAGMTPAQIAEAILDATPDTIMFTILAGWRLEEVAEALPTSGLNITPQDFLAAAHDPPGGYSFSAEIRAGGSIEGFLMPDIYELPRELNAQGLVITLLNRFDERITAETRQALTDQGLTLREAVIIASIVEREAVIEQEQTMIASVFLNRLAIGMALEADPTVQYARGYNPDQNTWWTNPLSASDLAFDSRYNTYIYAGLPPGPIANPSLSAILAVAYPAQTPYYFFRAACDNSGRHTFAETFEQHIANACP